MHEGSNTAVLNKTCRLKCGRHPKFQCSTVCRALQLRPSGLLMLPRNVSCAQGLPHKPQLDCAPCTKMPGHRVSAMPFQSSRMPAA
jgi:hypothetical protein